MVRPNYEEHSHFNLGQDRAHGKNRLYGVVRVEVRPWSMKAGNGDTEADGSTVNPCCSGPSSGCLPRQLHSPQYPHSHPKV